MNMGYKPYTAKIASIVMAATLALLFGCSSYYMPQFDNQYDLDGIIEVHYFPNGGTTSSVPVDYSTYIVGSSVIVKNRSNYWESNGQGFLGWNTASDGSGAMYYPGDTIIKGDDDIVLYARWISAIGDVVIPDGITTICDYAFTNCSIMSSISIPPSVTLIGQNAFSSCNGLTTLSIPASVTSIGSNAFSSCSGLTSITIPASVTSIGNNAFGYCSGLTDIIIPEHVATIGDGVFAGCFGLTSVTIPASVNSIGISPFGSCGQLTSIEVDSANPFYDSIDGILFNESVTRLLSFPSARTGDYSIPATVNTIDPGAFSGSSLSTITVPLSITSIGNNTFSSCYNLVSFSIPSSVTSIGDGSFFSCNQLTEITLPSGITSIGHAAFFCCSALTSVTVLAIVPSALEDRSQTFDYVSPGFQIRVPAGSVAAYKAATGWSEYASVIVSQ